MRECGDAVEQEHPWIEWRQADRQLGVVNRFFATPQVGEGCRVHGSHDRVAWTGTQRAVKKRQSPVIVVHKISPQMSHHGERKSVVRIKVDCALGELLGRRMSRAGSLDQACPTQMMFHQTDQATGMAKWGSSSMAWRSTSLALLNVSLSM